MLDTERYRFMLGYFRIIIPRHMKLLGIVFFFFFFFFFFVFSVSQCVS